jgi:photosystem II stability/assembly factor-like uncharacterized protein
MLPIFRAAIMMTLLSLVSSLSGTAAAAEYAPIMPLASRSLLLDITAAGERVVAAGERGHILYSDDQGRTWQQARVPTTQMLTGVYFVDDKRGWAVGHDGLILVSDDGGETWRVQRDGIAAQQQTNLALREHAHQQVEALELALVTADEVTLPELELALEDAVMDLEDADLALEEAVFTSPLMDVWFKDASHGWAVGAFGTLLATDNGGQNWVEQAAVIDNPDEFHLNTITGDSAGRIFIGGEGGVMFRSGDGGASWETLESFYDGSWFGALYSPQQDVLLIFGLRGNLFRSEDFGDTWNPVNTASHNTLADGAASLSGEITLVGSVGTVLRSSDGGLTFTASMMADRLSLSSVLYSDDQLILIGQGGIKNAEDAQ